MIDVRTKLRVRHVEAYPSENGGEATEMVSFAPVEADDAPTLGGPFQFMVKGNQLGAFVTGDVLLVHIATLDEAETS